jgi:hypothetical protein
VRCFFRDNSPPSTVCLHISQRGLNGPLAKTAKWRVFAANPAFLLPTAYSLLPSPNLAPSFPTYFSKSTPIPTCFSQKSFGANRPQSLLDVTLPPSSVFTSHQWLLIPDPETTTRGLLGPLSRANHQSVGPGDGSVRWQSHTSDCWKSRLVRVEISRTAFWRCPCWGLQVQVWFCLWLKVSTERENDRGTFQVC